MNDDPINKTENPPLEKKISITEKKEDLNEEKTQIHKSENLENSSLECQKTEPEQIFLIIFCITQNSKQTLNKEDILEVEKNEKAANQETEFFSSYN